MKKKDNIAKMLLEGKNCENCLARDLCIDYKNGEVVCSHWEEISASKILKILEEVGQSVKI